jgi:hypothetical protein
LPWFTPVAVFGPAASTDFDDAIRQSMEAPPGYDLEDYDIEPVLPGPILYSPGPPSPISLPTASATTRKTLPTTSQHAPSKRGTTEMAYRKAKGKAQEKLKAQQRKQAAPYGGFNVLPSQVAKHIKKSGEPIQTSLDANDMPHASTGYLGLRNSGGPKRVFGLDELVGDNSAYGFELRKWDGRYVPYAPAIMLHCSSYGCSTPTPIRDGKEHVIGICAGHPDDASWGNTKDDATAAMRDTRQSCRFPKGATSHRRGLFPALAVGASFRGGQEVSHAAVWHFLSI